MNNNHTDLVHYFSASSTETKLSFAARMIDGTDWFVKTTDREWKIIITGIRLEDGSRERWLFDGKTQTTTIKDGKTVTENFSITNGFFDSRNRCGNFKLVKIIKL